MLDYVGDSAGFCSDSAGFCWPRLDSVVILLVSVGLCSDSAGFC